MLIAAFLCFAAVSFAQDINVPLLEQLPTGEQKPRSPSVAPIACCVISDTIYLSFDSNLGVISVVLEEASEGIILQTPIDTSSLSAVIPFSGDPGEYCITITLPSGNVYEGRFVFYCKFVIMHNTAKKALITDCFASQGALTSQTNWYVVNNTGQPVFAGFMKNGKSSSQIIPPADTCLFTSLPYETSDFSNAIPDYYPTLFGMSINGTVIYLQYNGRVYKSLSRPFFNSAQWSSSTYSTQVGNTTIKKYYFTLSPSDII